MTRYCLGFGKLGLSGGTLRILRFARQARKQFIHLTQGLLNRLCGILRFLRASDKGGSVRSRLRYQQKVSQTATAPPIITAKSTADVVSNSASNTAASPTKRQAPLAVYYSARSQRWPRFSQVRERLDRHGGGVCGKACRGSQGLRLTSTCGAGTRAAPTLPAAGRQCAAFACP